MNNTLLSPENLTSIGNCIFYQYISVETNYNSEVKQKPSYRKSNLTLVAKIF